MCTYANLNALCKSPKQEEDRTAQLWELETRKEDQPA